MSGKWRKSKSSARRQWNKTAGKINPRNMRPRKRGAGRGRL